MGKKIFKAVDFFCGGGGMTCGLRQAGIKVLAGIDFDSAAKETYEYNNPGAKFINADINKLETDYLEKEFHIKGEDDSMIFVGCSPCQYYSIVRSSKAKSLKTKDLLMQFVRFIEYYKPGYVLVENVPGIMTNKDTVLNLFLQKLESLGYGSLDTGTCYYNIVNMNDYRIAQNRRRFSLIANRLGKRVSLPTKDKKKLLLKDVIGDKKKFPPIEAGYKDPDTVRFHSARKLSEKNIERLKKTPHDGGTRIAWAGDKKLQLNCYKNKDNSFRDVYGRLAWDKPSATITTKFLSISNGRFAHPEQNRGLSIREGATIQSFPKTYEFKTNSITVAARLIGNAVPPKYGKKLGKIILGE
jgi:DNA (cytosine-5)-methyltransferase 1